MTKTTARKPHLTLRKPVNQSQHEWISIRPLFDDRPYPTLIRPRIAGLNLAAWAANNRAFVDRLYREKRSLLFRGFDLDGIEGLGSFGAFVDTVSDGPRLPYMDRTTPRRTYGDNIYCTTVFPPDQRMPQHNEGSYWTAWSLKAFMHCVVEPETGGETPIADVHRVHDSIHPDVREEFAERRWQLVRNFNDGFGLPWQDVFQTKDKTEVERYCVENRIRFEWKGDGRLRTRQTRPAVRYHPISGEPLWFNHIAFYNIESRPKRLRDALLADFGEGDLPFNTYYGDGGRIEPAVIDHINRAFDEQELRWPWHLGDVHLFDNMRLSHGRQPFTGDRLILVALTEGYLGPEQ